jgi:outer membrane protein TolC
MADEVEIDVSDPKQVERRRKDIRQAALERNETIKNVMQIQGFRKWMYEILLSARIGSNPFSSDALLMAHSCGEMNVGLQLRSAIESAAPELYLQMMRENNHG